MKAIFHVHTKYSYDSLLSPKKIVDFCNKQNIDYIFITDHETISGALEGIKYIEKNNIPINIIIGIEIRTNIGDIIGIFIKEEIKSKNYFKVIQEIKSQGGIVILPHPYIDHDLFQIHFLKDIDFIEIFNSRTTNNQDEYAMKLCKYLGTLGIYGSDAHTKSELLNCIISFDTIENFKKGKFLNIKNKKINSGKKAQSQFIKDIKKKEPLLFIISILKIIFGFFFRY